MTHTHTISKSQRGAHSDFYFMNSSLLPVSRPVLSQTLLLPTSFTPSESEKPGETLPVFVSLQLKWLRRSWLGNRTVGGGRAWLGQWTLLGHRALLLRTGRRGWAVELCKGEPKWQMQSGSHQIKAASETQGFGYFSFH